MVVILLFMSVLSYQCQNSWSKNLCISVSLTKIWRINCKKLNMVLVIIGAFEVFLFEQNFPVVLLFVYVHVSTRRKRFNQSFAVNENYLQMFSNLKIADMLLRLVRFCTRILLAGIFRVSNLSFAHWKAAGQNDTNRIHVLNLKLILFLRKI